MQISQSLKITFMAIMVMQIPVFLAGIAWYPEVVARMLEYRVVNDLATAQGVYWNLAMAAVVASPVFLLLAPYGIAWQFWNGLGQLKYREAFA